jgi:flagellar biosynthesis GTPase FlhF
LRDDIAMQLAISLTGIALMTGLAGLLTWYKANNAMHSDAAIAASTNSEARRRSVAAVGPTGQLTTAIARFAARATLRAVANISPQTRIGIVMTDSGDETRRAGWDREAA